MTAGPLDAFDEFVMVRGRTSADAVVRLISQPLVDGLRDAGWPVRCLDPAGLAAGHAPAACLLFHHHDGAAIAAVRAAVARARPALVVALGADIYAYGDYARLASFVDLFLMPTEAHAAILSAQLVTPVLVLGEGVDPAATGGRDPAWPPARRGVGAPRLLWFGYPESFAKSIASLVPTIVLARERGLIAGLTVMTDPSRFRIDGPWDVTPYSEHRFHADARDYDYALLSHFSLDLHVNTLIKSPNKAHSALAAGLIPLATDTPNYGATLRALGLERFLFRSPASFLALLERLDPVADFAHVAAQRSVERLTARHSPTTLLDRFAECLAEHARAPAGLVAPPYREPARAALPKRIARRLLRMMADQPVNL